MAEVLLVNVDNSRVRTRCEVSVVSGYIDGRAPDAAVVVKTMQTVLGLQVPDVHLTANCKVNTKFVSYERKRRSSIVLDFLIQHPS